MGFSIETGIRPVLLLKMSGSLFAACGSVSVGMWVYCFDTVGESWPMNSRATASDTPAEWKPNPLSEQGFYGSPLACQNLRGDSRDGRAMAAKYPARNPTKYLAPDPRVFSAMAGQKQSRWRQTSVKTTRKTTCLAPEASAPCPRWKLARQPAICPRTSRAAAKAISRKRLLRFPSLACNHDLRKL